MATSRKLLEAKARSLKVPNIGSLKDNELIQQIKDRGGVVVDTPATPVISQPAKPPEKASEVPPTIRRVESFAVPNLVLNMPAPNVTMTPVTGPQWWNIGGQVKDAVLFMVAGAALFCLVLFARGVHF